MHDIPDPQHSDGPQREKPPRDGDARARAEELGAQATRLGGMVGRFARRAAAEAKPHAERGARAAARQTRAAADAAGPRIGRAASQARDFVQAHDEEFIRAAQVAAGLAAARVVPLPLRPIIVAVTQEFRRERAPAAPPAETNTPSNAAGEDVSAPELPRPENR